MTLSQRAAVETDPPPPSPFINVEDVEDALDWDDDICRLVPFDDGHTPRGVVDRRPAGRRVVYDAVTAESHPVLYVTDDDAASSAACRAWYDTMSGTAGVGASSSSSWGTYVTLEEIYRHWQRQGRERDDEGEIHRHDDDDDLETHRHVLAVTVAAQLVKQAWDPRAVPPTRSYHVNADDGGLLTMTTTRRHDDDDDDDGVRGGDGSTPRMPDRWRVRRFHGVAVWALRASDVGSSVPYHVDHAEQVRYVTDVLATPLWGGVLHCTPTGRVGCDDDGDDDDESTTTTMRGGEYYAYLGNPRDCWDHYQRHGYKSQLSPLKDDEDDENRHPHRVTIPYRTCRLIAQAGYLPHGSAAVTAFPSGTTTGRVVVGLNAFGGDVGPVVRALPEHSPRFTDWVRALSTSSRSRRREQKDESNDADDVSLRTLIRRHPQWARRVLRRRAQEDYRRAARTLRDDVERVLRERRDDGVSVAELQTRCRARGHDDDGRYPSSTDVWVYLERHCGVDYEIVVDDDDTKTTTTKSTTTAVRLVSAQQRIRLLTD